jgi:exodeoxyribonuclease VII small subunit
MHNEEFDNSLFDDAYEQLLFMVNQIEQDNVSLKDLASKIAEAKALVSKCDNALRNTEDAIKDAENEQ